MIDGEYLDVAGRPDLNAFINLQSNVESRTILLLLFPQLIYFENFCLIHIEVTGKLLPHVA
jgi:hypothetical protein